MLRFFTGNSDEGIMKSYFWILLFFSFKALGFEFSSADYLLLEGDAKLCSPGHAQLLQDEGEETFVLGPVISIPIIKEKSIDKVAGGKCQQVDELKDSKKKIIFTSVIQNCSQGSEHLEKRVVETVWYEGDKLFYTNVQGSATKKCHFQRVKK